MNNNLVSSYERPANFLDNENWCAEKAHQFSLIDTYIKLPPKKILDIGCGLARESELFQKKYGCELYLLDGDTDSTIDHSYSTGYHSVNDFKFFRKINTLQTSYNERGMTYNFIDANNIYINDSVIFDLVYSNVSYGFHYSFDTYKNLIVRHTSHESIIIVDIRKKAWFEQRKIISIVKILEETSKYIKAHINFKN